MPAVEKFAIGQSVRRLEDPHLVQGLGRYSDDVRLPRQAYAAVVRSAHAHARICGIDGSAALRMAGVLARTPLTAGVTALAVWALAVRHGKTANTGIGCPGIFIFGFGMAALGCMESTPGWELRGIHD